MNTENTGADWKTQLEQIRALYRSLDVADPRMAERYAWIIVKALRSEEFEADALNSRRYLAEYMQLPLPRPSRIHSAILGAACRMAVRFPDFHFAPFLQMWDVRHLRTEDYAQQRTEEGKVYHSLAERMAKAYMHAILLRPDERLPREQLEVLYPIAKGLRYITPRTMMVTSVVKSESGRRPMRFAHLIDAEGFELSCEIHALQPHPLVAPASAQHYVNVGQLYDVLPREKQLASDEAGSSPSVRIESAYLSRGTFGQDFPVAVGYVERYDASHQHYHVFDGASRHLVAHAAQQRLGQYGRPTVHEGDYVLFAPIVPKPKSPGERVFKSAYILSTYTHEEGAAAFGLRQAKVVYVDLERKFFRWELVDPSQPIVEEGTTEPAFTSGFANFGDPRSPHLAHTPPPQVGQTVGLIVYLRRGKDGQKRPQVVDVC